MIFIQCEASHIHELDRKRKLTHERRSRKYDSSQLAKAFHLLRKASTVLYLNTDVCWNLRLGELKFLLSLLIFSQNRD